jgi:hypothetical protein
VTRIFNTAQGVALAAVTGLAVWIGVVYAAFGLVSN